MRTGLRFLSERKQEDDAGLDIQEVTEKDDGTVEFGGYLLHWGDVAEIRDIFGSYTESFSKGAFDKTFRERGPDGTNAIKLLRMHDRSIAQAGKYLSLREEDAGPAFDARTILTDVGTNLGVELREGVMSAMSVGFNAIREVHDAARNHYNVLEAMMMEGSPVLWPAYETGTIDQVRALAEMPVELSRMLEMLDRGIQPPAEVIGQLETLRVRLSEILDRPLDQAPGSSEATEEQVEQEAPVTSHAETLSRLRLMEMS
jgi:HK97 family phage prohead protease